MSTQPRPDTEVLAAVIAQFRALPPEHDRAFEIQAAKIAEHADARLIHQLQQFLAGRLSLPDAPEDEDRIRFCAYFVIATYARRMKEPIWYDALRPYRPEFRSHVLFDHVDSLMLKSQRQWLPSLEAAERALDKLPEHVGVLHNFAEAVVLAKENGCEVPESQLEQARAAVTRAISIEAYPKFYATYGRLEALLGHYDRAMELVHRAIDEESSDKLDYPIRLADYQTHLTNIHLAKASHELETQLRETQRQLAAAREEFNQVNARVNQSIDELKRESLQILGFFTAALSLTIGSIQILSKQSFADAAMLLILLGGVLLMVYGGFILTIGGLPNRRTPVWLSMGLGALLILVGLIVHHDL
ncbi:MAG: hypothetical protein K6T81_14425 [Alicyclobacillus macrosporangiidus]|uniref:hypothetical protein n=1 Tax=Alicyclobacillus macrosporangiidus TaxID=392015 RepID=UPI0026EC23A2|nr:hypothetical protein [Alicyclobacillus macrosporangiidus]MCL6599912.1 hypothetical protein [Alicyclobacillus macrosporangiidus]